MNYYWHSWHDQLINRVNFRDRVREIKRSKPPDEQPLRLRLFKRAVLPPALVKSLNACDIVYEWGLLGSEWRAILALHRQQCKRCPWGDGIGAYRLERCIFTRRKKNGEWY